MTEAEKNKKKLAKKIRIFTALGIALMNALLSIAAAVVSGHFVLERWFICFLISLAVAFVIAYFVPIKSLTEKACKSAKAKPDTTTGKLVAGIVADVLFVPAITLITSLVFVISGISSATAEQESVKAKARKMMELRSTAQTELESLQKSQEPLKAEYDEKQKLLADLQEQLAAMEAEAKAKEPSEAAEPASQPDTAGAETEPVISEQAELRAKVSDAQKQFDEVSGRMKSAESGIVAKQEAIAGYDKGIEEQHGIFESISVPSLGASIVSAELICNIIGVILNFLATAKVTAACEKLAKKKKELI